MLPSRPWNQQQQMVISSEMKGLKKSTSPLANKNHPVMCLKPANELPRN